MDGFPRWRPAGQGVLISGAISSLGATKIGGPNAALVDYMVYNQGTSDAWLGFGMTSTAAVSNARAPLIGSPTDAIIVPATALFIVRLQPQPFVAAVTQLGSTNISITPGYGN